MRDEIVAALRRVFLPARRSRHLNELATRIDDRAAELRRQRILVEGTERAADFRGEFSR